MGTVGFGGHLNGLVSLCMSDECSEDAVGEIRGMSPAEVASERPEVRKVAIGEVTHRTVVGFKNALCQLGYPGNLTRPTIGRGQRLKFGAIKGAARGDDFFTGTSPPEGASDGARLGGGGRPGLVWLSARAVPTDDRRRRRPERGRSARARARDLGARRRGR